MKRHLLQLPLFVLSASLLFTACSKDDDSATPDSSSNNGGGGNNNNNSSSGSPTPTFVGSAGICWAVKSITVQTVPFIGAMEVEAGLGVAAFPNADNTGYVSAGDVSLNTTPLTLQSNNSYVNQMTQAQPTGIDFSGGVDWNVTGGNGIPAFQRSIATIPFPDCDTVTSATTVVRANGYTLSTSSVTGADSVIFVVGGVSKTLPGNSTSCTFTSAELSGISTGPSIVQIAPWTYTSETIDGRTIYFGKEIVQTRSVTVQ